MTSRGNFNFQTIHNADEKRDVTRGMKVITRWHLMRFKGRRCLT
ncbi:MAG: hypothetical protein PV344_01635 [Anaplasma sp.]|nr:hypothetical protein [Anaplasma sp.]